MPILPYLHFFSALDYLCLAAFILIKNPKSSLNRICAVVFGCFFLWCAGKTIAHNPYASKEIVMVFLKVVIFGEENTLAGIVCIAKDITERKKNEENLKKAKHMDAPR
jgi:hypothetical protein